jgi:beta-phosphoglucomutase family hydrolase
MKPVNAGVIWDMDGVIVDTGEYHFPAWVTAFAEREVPFTKKQFRDTFGMNNAGILEVIMGTDLEPALVAEISERKETLFRRAVKGHASLLPGVEGWLAQIKAWGYKQAIASSAPPANIDALVDELDIRKYFNAVVSGFDLQGKPDPAVFLKAANTIGVPPEGCIVIEDAVAGVEGARREGMKCIAVTTTNPEEKLEGADKVVDGLDEMPVEVVKQLLGL